ncbi:MAG: type II toxin-antitoxin system Phd/YefM family antitoxin [Candidatus Dormibacteria bacterium]
MNEVSIRELRNQGGAVIDRVAAGERLLITRDRRPVAELGPIQGRAVSAATLLARWRQIPVVDVAQLRADIDAVLDADL